MLPATPSAKVGAMGMGSVEPVSKCAYMGGDAAG